MALRGNYGIGELRIASARRGIVLDVECQPARGKIDHPPVQTGSLVDPTSDRTGGAKRWSLRAAGTRRHNMPYERGQDPAPVHAVMAGRSRRTSGRDWLRVA